MNEKMNFPRNPKFPLMYPLAFFLGSFVLSFHILPLVSWSNGVAWIFFLLQGGLSLYLLLFSSLSGECSWRSLLSFLPLSMILQSYLHLGLWSWFQQIPWVWVENLSFLRYSLLFVFSFYLLGRFYFPSSPAMNRLFLGMKHFFYGSWVYLLLRACTLQENKLIPWIRDLLGREDTSWLRLYPPLLLFFWWFPLFLLILGQIWAFLLTQDISWSLRFLPFLFLLHFHEIFLLAWERFVEVNEHFLRQKISSLEKAIPPAEEALLLSYERNLALLRNLSLLRREYLLYFQSKVSFWIPLRLLFLCSLWFYLSYLCFPSDDHSRVVLQLSIMDTLRRSFRFASVFGSRSYSVQAGQCEWHTQLSLEKQTHNLFEKGHFLVYDDEEIFVNQGGQSFFLVRGSWTSKHPNAVSITENINVTGQTKAQKLLFFLRPVAVLRSHLHPIRSGLLLDPNFQSYIQGLIALHSPGYVPTSPGSMNSSSPSSDTSSFL